MKDVWIIEYQGNSGAWLQAELPDGSTCVYETKEQAETDFAPLSQLCVVGSMRIVHYTPTGWHRP